jgi:vanillate O-demethylase ferredoxin subunit
MESMALSSASDAGTLAARLQSVRYAAKGIHLFEFAALNGPFPAAEPGSHLDIYLPGEMRRQYSLVTPLCSASAYVVAIKREDAGRGGSIWLHDEARVGAEFHIGAPRNNFALDEEAKATLLLAGGIGITPLYSMFERLQELGRPVRLHYWCRSADHALFRSQLDRHPDVTLHYSSATGRASLSKVLGAADPGAEIYCCGPSRMLGECIEHVARLSLSRLHVERFVNETPPTGDVPASAPFVVALARKGIDIEVGRGESILQALIAADIDVPYSCEEGVCGACETKVLDGAPLHYDAVRSAEDHQRLGTIMICCSRSRTARLVLDI